jgi:hypothetical protein
MLTLEFSEGYFDHTVSNTPFDISITTHNNQNKIQLSTISVSSNVQYLLEKDTTTSLDNILGGYFYKLSITPPASEENPNPATVTVLGDVEVSNNTIKVTLPTGEFKTFYYDAGEVQYDSVKEAYILKLLYQADTVDLAGYISFITSADRTSLLKLEFMGTEYPLIKNDLVGTYNMYLTEIQPKQLTLNVISNNADQHDINVVLPNDTTVSGFYSTTEYGETTIQAETADQTQQLPITVSIFDNTIIYTLTYNNIIYTASVNKNDITDSILSLAATGKLFVHKLCMSNDSIYLAALDNEVINSTETTD